MKKLHPSLSLALLCLPSLLFPGSSTAQNYRPFAGQLTPQTDGAASQAQTLALPLPAVNSAFNTDFTMRPSVFTTSISPYGAGPQNLPLRIGCIDLITLTLIPNAVIELIAPSAERFSGGHMHDTMRPAGSVSPDHGVTGPATNPILPVTYTAPEASGITDLAVTCSPQGGTPVTGIFTIGIEIDGLVQVTSGPPSNPGALFVDTQSNMHDNNNGNATPQTIGALDDMATLFADLMSQKGVPQNQIPIIFVTALSLPQGGLFDYSVEWKPPHKLHRNGTDADVGLSNLTTSQQRQALIAAFRKTGFRAPVAGERPEDRASNHWHLKARGGA